jgi:hypothetical protein
MVWGWLVVGFYYDSFTRYTGMVTTRTSTTTTLLRMDLNSSIATPKAVRKSADTDFTVLIEVEKGVFNTQGSSINGKILSNLYVQ